MTNKKYGNFFTFFVRVGCSYSTTTLSTPVKALYLNPITVVVKRYFDFRSRCCTSYRAASKRSWTTRWPTYWCCSRTSSSSSATPSTSLSTAACPDSSGRRSRSCSSGARCRSTGSTGPAAVRGTRWSTGPGRAPTSRCCKPLVVTRGRRPSAGRLSGYGPPGLPGPELDRDFFLKRFSKTSFF